MILFVCGNEKEILLRPQGVEIRCNTEGFRAEGVTSVRPEESNSLHVNEDWIEMPHVHVCGLDANMSRVSHVNYMN